MKHKARDDIPADVIAIRRDAMMAQLETRLFGTDDVISSVMTVDSLDALEEGDRVHVIGKAVNVLLVKP